MKSSERNSGFQPSSEKTSVIAAFPLWLPTWIGNKFPGGSYYAYVFFMAHEDYLAGSSPPGRRFRALDRVMTGAVRGAPTVRPFLRLAATTNAAPRQAA